MRNLDRTSEIRSLKMNVKNKKNPKSHKTLDKFYFIYKYLVIFFSF